MTLLSDVATRTLAEIPRERIHSARPGPLGNAGVTHSATGFTLIEIMVVVVILGILVAFAVPNIMDNPQQARLTKARSDIRTIENALEMYKLDNYRFPTTEQGLEALVEEPNTPPEPKNYKAGGYLRELPKDPWGTPYQYLGARDTEGPRPRLLTLGADNRRGGEGADQDISNLDTDDE